MTKQVVQYAPSEYDYIAVGQRASVIPVNHPDTFRVDNGLPATTTAVQSYNSETGVFETLNTLYIPVAAQQ